METQSEESVVLKPVPIEEMAKKPVLMNTNFCRLTGTRLDIQLSELEKWPAIAKVSEDANNDQDITPE